MKIKEKLHSSKGASLIIALVFMLFCAMIGSAVLAAATANGGRVAALKSDQQEYLDQRSAATLLSDELQIDRPKLTVKKEHVVTTTYEVGDGGVLTQVGSSESDTVKFEVSGNVTTQLQRILFESAILRYMQTNDMDGYDKINISGFSIPGANGSENKTINNVSGFILYDSTKGTNQDPVGTLTVDLSEGTVGTGTPVTSFSATVGCVGPIPANLDVNKTVSPYTFNVSFGDGAGSGEDAKLYLRMYAAAGSPHEFTYETQERGSSSTELVKVKTTTTTQTISWDPPEILKGAAKWNS